MNLHDACPLVPRLSVLASGFVLAIVAGWPAAPAQAAVRNAEDLMIVDCLLPGQIRKLGRQATYLSARRPVRTTQADCEIRGGEYVAYDRANYQTALKVWLEGAMSGDAEAQNNVGEIYSKGLGTAPDYGMAFQWFKKAADQGYARAKINLGYLYEQGLGVERDQAAALNLYREASGIEDELMYASVVQVQIRAKDEQITGLQEQVQAGEAESAALREQVERSLEMHRRTAPLECQVSCFRTRRCASIRTPPPSRPGNTSFPPTRAPSIPWMAASAATTSATRPCRATSSKPPRGWAWASR